jgi:hypothetical protein
MVRRWPDLAVRGERMWYVELCWFDKRRIIHPLKEGRRGLGKVVRDTE